MWKSSICYTYSSFFSAQFWTIYKKTLQSALVYLMLTGCHYTQYTPQNQPKHTKNIRRQQGVCTLMPMCRSSILLFPFTEQMLKYQGSNYLRQRLVLSTLSSKPTRIENIRVKDSEPGLKGWVGFSWPLHVMDLVLCLC